MSTPMELIEQYAGELAVNTALLTNKLHAAAVVACQFRPRTSEEDFIEVARLAYRQVLEKVEQSKADYLAKMTGKLKPAPEGQTAGRGEGR